MNTVAAYRYTDGEIKELLSTLTMVIDSREQVNDHITDYLNKQQIPFIKRKLDYGDYACYLPKNEALGIMRDMHFPIAIERKNSVDELASTIKERTRFENELIRSQQSNFVLLVEDAAGYENIILGNYRSEYNARALLASLKAFEARYNFRTVFVDPRTSGNYIYYTFLYYVREKLK